MGGEGPLESPAAGGDIRGEWGAYFICPWPIKKALVGDRRRKVAPALRRILWEKSIRCRVEAPTSISQTSTKSGAGITPQWSSPRASMSGFYPQAGPRHQPRLAPNLFRPTAAKGKAFAPKARHPELVLCGRDHPLCGSPLQLRSILWRYAAHPNPGRAVASTDEPVERT